ncbi:MarR family transcriptional regulator [Paenibacillus sp. 2TAB23]|uniref:MarR family transcriptional regulator n=1 Tax=Paenibacillus sp. 2TAB23 TaxID=3233004 RepID=UPI003F9C0376
MIPSESLKRLLYGRFLHYTHLTEQMFSSEIDGFAELAREHGISSFPNSMTSVHVIDCIGNNEPINNVSIAEKMNLSKASITKISTKLLQEGYIKRSQLNDNKKEVYFSLSFKGKRIFEVHALMHEQIERNFISLMSSFTEAELQASLKFFQMMIDQGDSFMKGDDKAGTSEEGQVGG